MPEEATPSKRPASTAALDFPVIFLLSANLGSQEIQDLEDQIPTLTYDIDEAEVVLGKVFRKERALFELRKHKLATEEVGTAEQSPTTSRESKRAKLSASALASSDVDSDTSSDGEGEKPVRPAPSGPTVKVVKLPWLTDSIKSGEVLPLDDYIVYEGRKMPKTPQRTPPPPPAEKAAEVMRRALADASTSPGSPRRKASQWRRAETLSSSPIRSALLRETTPEHELDAHLPPIPDYLRNTYSCQRPTPMNPPNEAFIAELAKIKTARTLMGDKVGVRAYSTAIATVAAYPHLLQTAPEVARLPGCGTKIAVLFQEFHDTGQVKEAQDDTSDPKLAVLRLFYSIWGVAETTARDFYNRGWRDLDDVVEYGWDTLTRVQQIGVKYHDEFELGIPRAEVEAISAAVLAHAERLRPGFCMVVVGGYRRGKSESGDVDVLLSHPDEAATRDFVGSLVVSLEHAGLITHTLALSTTNSERGQVPVSWKGNVGKKLGQAGFDTLDKAMVVWQEPAAAGDSARPHRRVDIIVSPWRTAGCAVVGWSGGTTFQRDLRRWCKRERGLKFDSSGVRSRKDGAWVDLESGSDGAPAPDMLTAERRVFERLGLAWREPGERCTG